MVYPLFSLDLFATKQGNGIACSPVYASRNIPTIHVFYENHIRSEWISKMEYGKTKDCPVKKVQKGPCCTQVAFRAQASCASGARQH
jgi:hypothetical protein